LKLDLITEVLGDEHQELHQPQPDFLESELYQHPNLTKTDRRIRLIQKKLLLMPWNV
jgi:hypothetical protein